MTTQTAYPGYHRTPTRTSAYPIRQEDTSEWVPTPGTTIENPQLVVPTLSTDAAVRRPRPSKGSQYAVRTLAMATAALVAAALMAVPLGVVVAANNIAGGAARSMANQNIPSTPKTHAYMSGPSIRPAGVPQKAKAGKSKKTTRSH